MVKARIQLSQRGPISFTGRGRTIKRGDSFITTNAADIRYFQQVGGFSVSVLEGKMPKSAPSIDEDDDDEGATSEEVKDTPAADEPVTAAYTHADLSKMSKASLVELASGEGVKVDSSMSKSAMITAILESQGEDEGDTPEE